MSTSMIVTPDGMITEHFSWQEAFVTVHHEIDNHPTQEEIGHIEANIERAANKLEKVRALLGVPLIISSWFRNPQLNAAVGGVASSDHLTGSAIDFISPQLGTPLDICKKILESKEIIGFKQLILEHTWVHISFPLIPGTVPKLEVLSLLTDKKYATGLTDKSGNPLT